jgi:hypothetical protein
MMSVQLKKDRQAGFAEANPNPVLSSRADGVLQFVNPATSRLVRELELNSVEDILPSDHKELVRNCLATGTRLTKERKAGGRDLVWSYQSIDDKDEIYIYGHDVSDYQASTSDTAEFPMANPSPVLAIGVDGAVHFSNPATSQLLQDLGLADIEEILPGNHREMMKNCLKTSTPLTQECTVCNRTLVWLYRSVSDRDEVYIYGHDVSDYQSGTHDPTEFPMANPSPVLATGVDGKLHFSNPATSQLLEDLGLDDLEKILPRNHKKLAKDCLKTSTPLTEERKVGGRTLVWIYRSHSESDEIFIYGHDISGCDPKIFCIEGFPKANPNPIFSSGKDGVPRFMNHATSQLLQDLELESTEDILPHNHLELVHACLNTNTPIIRERQVSGRTIIWSYYPIDESDLIYIYGHDITDYHPDTF